MCSLSWGLIVPTPSVDHPKSRKIQEILDLKPLFSCQKSRLKNVRAQTIPTP